jgi:pimeloyl-ACP methyl ester carboxylesterase
VVRSIRTAAVVALLALAGSACSNGSAKSQTATPTAGPSSAGSTLESYYQQRVPWSDCGDGFQCGSIRVPLDYAHPGGGEDIKLQVIRLPAQNRSARIGSLVTNPGGPGGSGISFVRESARSFDQNLLSRFDLVGFDPRGVGTSDPIRCLTGPQLDRFLATDSSPDDKQEVSTLNDVSKGFADGCKSRSNALLPYVGTATAARDIDILRAALGDQKLSYYGASYGTYLGAYYADEFPAKVRALVLDGAIDPKLSAADVNLEQAKGFETALRSFAADCITRAGCPLGQKSTDDALAQVSALLDKVDKTPLANSSGDGRQVTQALTVMGIATALYSKQTWPALRQGLTAAIGQGDGTLLLQLADALVERKPDGTYSNQTESNMAVNCVDKPYPTDLATYQQEADQSQKVAPRFGPFVMWGSLPCAYWPVKDTQQPKALTAPGSAPIVVVGTLRDPATPYQWAKNLAAELSSGILLSLDGDGHTAYLQGNSCIQSAVDAYLLNLQPPTKGTLCK